MQTRHPLSPTHTHIQYILFSNQHRHNAHRKLTHMDKSLHSFHIEARRRREGGEWRRVKRRQRQGSGGRAERRRRSLRYRLCRRDRKVTQISLNN